MLLNFNPTPRRVTIEFEDGTTETFEIGPKSGFLREAYTYQADHRDRICAVLHTYELYWSEVKEDIDALYSRPSKTDRGVS